MGGKRADTGADTGDDLLVSFFRAKGYALVTKPRGEYLSYYGLDQSSVIVLVSGVVKASVILREGREFNISFIQAPSPVSLLRDEESAHTASPFNVRVVSPEASYLVVPRVVFWGFVNEDEELLRYIKDYYRANLEHSLRRVRYLTMNGKTGAVGALLHEWARRFGVPCGGDEPDSLRIALPISNEDIACFCGISSRNSVNRILRGFREAGIISTGRGDLEIVVHDMAALSRYVMD